MHQQSGFEAHWCHDGIRRSAKNRTQIEQTQQRQEADGYPGSDIFHPGRHLPLAGRHADAQRDQHHDAAVTQREQRATPACARRRLAQVVTRQTVYRGQMVGIKSVFGTKHEHQSQQGNPVIGKFHEPPPYKNRAARATRSATNQTALGSLSDDLQNPPQLVSLPVII